MLDSLAVPPEVALVELRRDRKAVAFPERQEGLLRLLGDDEVEEEPEPEDDAPTATEAVEDPLRVEVSRWIRDGVPLMVATRIALRVSGRTRELTLPWPLWDDAELLRIDSDLPVHFGADRALVLQARSGSHTVTLEGALPRQLETLGPPALAASDANERRIFKGFGPTVSYVPVNDARLGKPPASDDLGKLKDAGLSLLPEFRSRQPRSFPVAVPHDEVVHLIWSDAEPDEHRDGLATLARKAVSIGHSASLVQMWLSDDPPEANWHPVEGVAEHRMRVFAPGRLDYLAIAGLVRHVPTLKRRMPFVGMILRCLPAYPVRKMPRQ